MRIIIGVTGASGGPIAKRFIERCPFEKHIVISKWGKMLLKEEADCSLDDLKKSAAQIYSYDDLAAPLASGSNRFDAMVVLPCDMTTLGRIAAGIGENLLTRAAEVMIKEQRKLILCIRETPLSPIALENCLKLSRAGVMIMPLSPPFYYKPKNLEQLIDDFVDRLLSSLGVDTGRGWKRDLLERDKE